MIIPINPGAPARRVRTTPATPQFGAIADGPRVWVLDSHTLDLYRVTVPILEALESAGPGVCGPRGEPAFPDPGAPGPCRVLVLNLTHACNLRCEYCFVRAADQQMDDSAERDMREDVALGAIRALSPGRIGFFGGEPLMRFPALRKIADAYGGRFSVTTNGTLLDADAAAWFGERASRCSMIVSLDGDRDRHNRLRPLASGDSHAATVAGLHRLAEAGGPKPTLRSTFTAEGCDLAAELETLNALCDEGLGGHVSIEPVSLTESCCFGAHALTASALRAMEPMYMDAADWFIHRAKQQQRARFHHLTKMIERLARKIPQCTECGAGRGYLTLSPDWTLHACHREGSRVGRMAPVDGAWAVVFEDARELWRDNRLTANRDCPSCPWRWLCGGGCRYDALQAGDLRAPNPLTCELTRLRVKMAARVIDEVGIDSACDAAGVKR